ncbi:MAG: FHA domain-containing protein, partial [Chloroflexi bacterium]
TYQLDKESYSIGRAEENDIPIRSPIVSRHHARLARAGSGYRLEILPEAANPVLFQGRPLKGERLLSPGDALRIGSQDPGVMVSLVYSAQGDGGAGREQPIRQIQFGEKNRFQIGRDPANDIMLDAPTVSRFHAEIERIGQRSRVRDLRSSNGVFVNNQRIDTEKWLKPGDTLRVGPYRFAIHEQQLEQFDETGGLEVAVYRLNKWVRKDLNILKDVSLVVQPREFIVVVGQSGGGKSTLVDAISGYRPATHGRVLVNGVDIYQHFEAIRSQIGFVPQRDIIHMELTVYQALNYAARLRMPADTRLDERHQRIMEVMEDLDLTHRKDLQVSSLSGGQQKRVSIGVELLTRPGLFFLDEPTSGLDPATETSLMQLLRRLADQGRTILLVTHATKNVLLADKVVFMARGGYLAWYGPPDEALEYFDRYRSERDRRAGRITFDDIYTRLEDSSQGSAEDWAERYRESGAYQQYIFQPLAALAQGENANQVEGAERSPASNSAAAGIVSKHVQVNWLRQFGILFTRHLHILTRNRLSMVLLLLAPILIGSQDILVAALNGRNPFDPTTGDTAKVMISMFLLTVYSLLVGALTQMREIVKEQDIYQRERLVCLKIFPYVLSKFCVALLFALYQAATYTIIHYLAFDMPGGATEFLLIYVTLVLGAVAGMMLGLLASAISPTAAAVPLILLLLLVPNIVLSGGLAGVVVPPTLSAPIFTHWVYTTLVGITGIGSDVAADVCWDLPDEVRSIMTIDQKVTFGCRCMGPALFQPGSCDFPGLHRFYHPAMERPPPAAPPPPGDPPAEPTLPAQPQEPADRADQVAMAEYLGKMKAWQAEVEQIQASYKRNLQVYQNQADIYKSQATTYQQELVNWQFTRLSATKPAEVMIEELHKNYEWAFINKEDQDVFWRMMNKSWLALAVIITVLFLLILFIQKRKDQV